MRKLWTRFLNRLGLYRPPEKGLLFDGRPIPYLENIDTLRLETSGVEVRHPLEGGRPLVTVSLTLTGTFKERA